MKWNNPIARGRELDNILGISPAMLSPVIVYIVVC